ncbi:Ig-like domain-containing protein [candidate division TA06 bacterium]|uniref:Ig-like domain-containing protein n=1 Tax=candidate division TA06 bacterium TaxID=2250710 RepID=A0A933IAD9_UNCT6|nr:Ig-like domain-containing protein [candidate division TA06 bacterium]
MKKIFFIMLAVWVAAPSLAVAQDTLWTRFYNGPDNKTDRAVASAIDSSGKFLYVVGTSYNSANSDVIVIKYDTYTGNPIWTNRFDAGYSEEATGCAVDDSGNIYVVGAMTTVDPAVWLVMRYNFGGSLAWWDTLNVSPGSVAYARDCAIYKSQWLYVTGDNYIAANGNDVALSKINPQTGVPNQLWKSLYSTAEYEYAFGCAVDDTGNIYICGRTYNGANNDYFILQTLDSAVSWTRTYNSGGNDAANDCIVDTVGKYLYVVGEHGQGLYMSAMCFNITQPAATIDTLWLRTYPFGDYEQANGCALDAAGKLYITGTFQDTIAGIYRMVSLKVDNNGTPVWSRVFKASAPLNDSSAYGYACAVNKKNNRFYVAGQIKSGNAADLLVVNYGLQAPRLTFPQDGTAINYFPAFAWRTVAGADTYRLEYGTVNPYQVLGTSGWIADTTFQMPAFWDSVYYWKVKAFTSGFTDSSAWSPEFTFRVDRTQPVITYTCPYDGETVALGEQITIAFSEPVQATTFNFSCSPDPLGWTTAWNANSDTVWLWHNDFAAGATYTFQVNGAMDLAGNGLGASALPNPWSFSTASDITPPNIANISANSDPLHEGTGYAFRANISDDIKMGPVTLYWATAGYNGYNFFRTMNPTAILNEYQADISGAEIRRTGVQYQIAAVDSAGNTSYYPGLGDYYIHSVHYDRTVNPPSTFVPNDQWQMLSIPADARNTNIFGQIANDLGPYDNTKWRLFIWGNGNYGEIPGLGSGTIYKLGQAYWLRQRIGNPANISFEGPDSSYGNFNKSAIVSLTLDSGWTDVGSPFMFDIPWANVTATSSDVFGPYAYNGSAWLNPGEILSGGYSFTPFQGYSYTNNSGMLTTLNITPSMAKKKGAPAVSLNAPSGWQALVKMENANGQDNNYLGIGIGTSEQRDRYDYPEPPSGLTGTSGYFRLDGDRFCTDIRPELGDGQTWSFAVDCQGQTNMTITLPPEFPAGTECYLADMTRQISVNIRDNSFYNFTPEPGEKVREFKIIAGQADYAKGVLGSSFALPSVTLLLQNRPNPYKQSTMINYQLAKSGPVRLAVYNVAGQLVKALVDRPQMAGRYAVAWNGRDESGRQAAAGVYFYRLTSNDGSAAKTMSLIK